MKMEAIKEKARKFDIRPGSMDKKTLIRTIQEKEGNRPCFKTGRQTCEQYDCCWRSDCKPGQAAIAA